MTFAGFLEGKFTIPASTAIAVTTNGGGPTTVTITAGSYFPTLFASQLQTDLTTQRPVSGGAWTVLVSETTGKITIGVTVGTFSITWTSTNMRSLLGYNGNISGASSSTASFAMRGYFAPDCPLNLDGDLSYPDLLTDLRQTEGPTGLVFGFVGNTKYRFRNLRYALVPRSRIFGFSADGLSTPTWEQFLKDVHLGQGHSFFTPSSKIRVCHDGDVDEGWLGWESFASASVGWYMKGITAFSPRKVDSQGWTGLWAIEIPELVSDGT